MTDPDDLLAIELALDLLDSDARAEAERRLASDPAFAALHDRWRGYALALLEGREERPSPYVWTAILRRLPQSAVPRAVRWWQASTALAASLALALGATLALRQTPAPVVVRPHPVAPPLVAVLASAERKDVVAVRYYPAARRWSARPTALATGGGTPVLWVIPGGGAPVALGQIAADTRTAHAPAGEVANLLVPGATLALSLEPRGEPIAAAPRGPVILTGTIVPS